MKLTQRYTVTAPFCLFLASLLTITFLLPAVIPAVQASPAQHELTATTDMASYGRNQTITVSGTLTGNGQPQPGATIGIQVNDPHGGVHTARMTSTAIDGYYAAAIHLQTTAPYGTYTVYVAYQEARATTSFNLTSQPPTDTMPPEIHAINVTHITPTSAVVTWMTNEPATGHVAYGDSTMPHTTEPGEHGIHHQASLRDLDPDTTIHIQVHVHDSSSNHNTSSPHTFTTQSATGDTTPPARVANLTATPTPSMYSTYGGTIHLQWSPGSDNRAIDHYNIYRDQMFIAAATTTSVHDTELAINHTYTYRVSAVDTSGNEGPRSQPATASTTTSPMPFTINSIDVQPAEIEPGDTATVTVNLSNTRNQSMSHRMELYVNGSLEATRNITVQADTTTTITFTVTRDTSGTYTIAVGDTTATLAVTATADSMPLPTFLVIGAFLLALSAASTTHRGERP